MENCLREVLIIRCLCATIYTVMFVGLRVVYVVINIGRLGRLLLSHVCMFAYLCLCGQLILFVSVMKLSITIEF